MTLEEVIRELNKLKLEHNLSNEINVAAWCDDCDDSAIVEEISYSSYDDAIMIYKR